MSLTDLWHSAQVQLRDKHVAQIIAFAGEGKLRDQSAASMEFRGFLGEVQSPTLRRYAEECLTGKFEDGGLALQDVVNQIGRRLGFTVHDGRYRGVPKQIGLDGLWISQLGYRIVVEVKTTDAYRIDLDTIAAYREALIGQGDATYSGSSILIVVGRQDTGDLEAQIRGSRHAWDIRLISVDSLLRLMAVKEEVENPTIEKQISEILIPREFTRVDGIIDLVFATASDVLDSAADDVADDETKAEDAVVMKDAPVGFHEACVARIEQQLQRPFLRRSRVTFSTPDEQTLLVCAVSKEYRDASTPNYWYAFHPHQKIKLESVREGFVAFGCGSPAVLLLVPYDDFAPLLAGMNMTQSEDREYWHVHIFRDRERLVLHRRKGEMQVDLTKYLVTAP